jgi:hypothetical protein
LNPYCDLRRGSDFPSITVPAVFVSVLTATDVVSLLSMLALSFPGIPSGI